MTVIFPYICFKNLCKLTLYLCTYTYLLWREIWFSFIPSTFITALINECFCLLYSLLFSSWNILLLFLLIIKSGKIFYRNSLSCISNCKAFTYDMWAMTFNEMYLILSRKVTIILSDEKHYYFILSLYLKLCCFNIL